MTNPFAPTSSVAASPTASNPRGQSFRIKTGDEIFEGRAANVPWVNAQIQRLHKHVSQEMSDVMAEEVVPRFAKLHERVDQADNELQDLRERMAHLETELGVADIDKSASTFRSRRGGSDAV